MKLKLKESIRANGVQYLPPSVIDSEEIGISQADVDVLLRRGTADMVAEEAPKSEEVKVEDGESGNESTSKTSRKRA